MSRRGLLAGLTTYLLVAAALTIVVWQSSLHLSPKGDVPPTRPHLEHADELIGPWLGWDASFYASIADGGYPASDRVAFDASAESLVAFFPGYPFLAGAVGAMVGDVGLGLWLVTVCSGALGFLLLLRWGSDRLGRTAGLWATAALFAFPWSFVLYGAGYSEALFLAAAVGAFLLLERDRPVAAGLVGAIAAVTRAAGIGVVIGLAVRAAERRGALTRVGWRVRLDWRRLEKRDGAVLLAGAGLTGWVAFGWLRYGDPLAFSTAQRGWSQGLGQRSLLKLGLWEQVQHNQDRGFVLLLVLQAAVILAACALIPAVWRRLGAGYGLYCAFALGLPLLGSANFISNGRFVAVAFPVFGVVGDWLAARPTARSRVLLVGGSAIALGGFASYWGRGYLMG